MINALHLFPIIDQYLIHLLKDLRDEEWQKPTIAGSWTVKDVAAHLLDTAMRSVSMYRDQFIGDKPESINSYSTLVSHLNKLNADWVIAFQRVSPLQIIDWLEESSAHQYKLMQKLEPSAPAIFSVAWAGEAQSTNAFHINREYTEKFHHQLQIREAVGQTAILMTRELFFPFISTLMLGLPHAYRNVDAPEGSSVTINISGDAGGTWEIIKKQTNWQLANPPGGHASATISMDPSVAWKLFTKGLTVDQALGKVQVHGDFSLAMPCLDMVSVMALR